MPKRRRPDDDDGECKSFAVVVIVEQNQLARFFFLRSFPRTLTDRVSMTVVLTLVFRL